MLFALNCFHVFVTVPNTTLCLCVFVCVWGGGGGGGSVGGGGGLCWLLGQNKCAYIKVFLFFIRSKVYLKFLIRNAKPLTSL